MPLPRVSLSTFLSTAKRTLQNSTSKSPPITIVVGNESADLDSLCSALVLAYLRSYAPFPHSTSPANTLYIPLSNLHPSDLPLRPELHPVLSRAHLQASDLITLSDLPAPTALAPHNTRWLLVDHNALQGELGKRYGARMVGCIDHHDEEGAVPQDCGGEPRVVWKSGSCASLVVEACRGAWDALSAEGRGGEGDEEGKWDEELAYLALAPVLVDTTNLTSKGKVTDADVEAVRYLEEKSKVDKDGYFKELSKAKQDIGGLNLRDILRKDYKQWNEANSTVLGVSSVVKDIQFMIDKAGSELKFLDTMKAFAKERDLSICSIMTTANHADGFKRELFIWALDEKGVKAAKKFEEEARGKLGLKTWGSGKLDDDEGGWRRCWWQERIENSRKQVAPLLRTAVTKR